MNNENMNDENLVSPEAIALHVATYMNILQSAKNFCISGEDYHEIADRIYLDFLKAGN